MKKKLKEMEEEAARLKALQVCSDAGFGIMSVAMISAQPTPC